MSLHTQPDGVVDPQELWASTVDEAVFQQHVVQIAIENGWMVHHHDTTAPTTVYYRHFNKQTGQSDFKPIRSRQIIGPGFPDLVLVHAGRQLVIFAELKVQDAHKGKRKRDQYEWGNTLEAAGATYYLWRPGDMGEIERILQGEVQSDSGSARL